MWEGSDSIQWRYWMVCCHPHCVPLVLINWSCNVFLLNKNEKRVKTYIDNYPAHLLVKNTAAQNLFPESIWFYAFLWESRADRNPIRKPGFWNAIFKENIKTNDGQSNNQNKKYKIPKMKQRHLVSTTWRVKVNLITSAQRWCTGFVKYHFILHTVKY